MAHPRTGATFLIEKFAVKRYLLKLTMTTKKKTQKSLLPAAAILADIYDREHQPEKMNAALQKANSYQSMKE